MSKHSKPRHRQSGNSRVEPSRASLTAHERSIDPAVVLQRPFFQSPIKDLRYFRREMARSEIPRWLPLWFGAIAVLFFLSTLPELRLSAGLALRAVLFGGAAWSLRHQRKLSTVHSQLSILFTIVLVAVVLLVGLVVGGSIMELADWFENH